ncbi:MAG TPA: ROK family transcriptional regulator [Spirochaetales bacterium]|nr:ROK family transcriptional regulator [Spirochaetales bacterium]
MTRPADKRTRTAARIFRAVWRNPGVSRIDLAKMLDLDKSTVTNQVAALLTRGLINETEEKEASKKGGRKPIELAVNHDYGRFVGIEIQLGFYEAVVVDMAGKIIGTKRGAIDTSNANFADIVVGIIDDMEKEYCQRSILLGVGVGTAGLVDSKRGRIRYSVPLEIDRPFDFSKAMAGRTKVPVFIENDANCCAWGELAFNKKEELKDFLFALVEYRQDRVSLTNYGGMGVGFGIVLGGRVHTGAHGVAGEFRSAFCNGKSDVQFSLPKEELVRISEDRSVLEKAADELSRNMAMLINTMDFSQVFIGGDIEALALDLPMLLRKRIEENWMYTSPKEVEVRYSSFQDKAVAYGAAGMVFERLLSERQLPGLES